MTEHIDTPGERLVRVNDGGNAVVPSRRDAGGLGRRYASYPAWNADWDAVPSDTSDLRRFLSALARRWWLAAGMMALTCAGAVAYLMAVTPTFEARTKLLIDPVTPNIVSFKTVIEPNTEKLDYYETQLGILRSRTLARQTLDSLALWAHPDLVEPATSIRRVRESASRLVPWLRPSAAPVSETAAQSRVIDLFLDRVTIAYRADNRLVDVGFRSSDPRVAALVANTLAKVYIDQNLALKLHAAKDASTWLNDRLAEQRRDVEASELGLQQYREGNSDVSSPEQQSVAVQKLTELSTAATKAKTERIEAESVYNAAQALHDSPASADALPAALVTPFIQQLKTELADLQREQAALSARLGDWHPDLVKLRASIADVQGQLRSEIARQVAAARNQLRATQAKEVSLTNALDEQQRVVLALNRRGLRYSAVQREVASNRQMFDALLERAKQMEISGELKTTNIHVVDAAEVPQMPASPRPRLILVLAAVVGVPLGLLLVAGVEYFDDRIKSPEEIQAQLGVKFLGFSPSLSGRRPKSSVQILQEGVPPEFAEALRTVRANLFMAPHVDGPRIVLITSTGPGEGKTSVATNLAVTVAQAGRTVLLVDADMRQGRIHTVFDVPVEPGLSTVLEDAMPVAQAMRSSQVAGLSILTAGAVNAMPSDLLEMPVLSRALAAVHDAFDWIIIDSPPVMVASDAISLAHVATDIVFVVGSQMTHQRHARAALDQLDAAHTPIVGAVLSRANVTTHSPYYGHYNYHGHSRMH